MWMAVSPGCGFSAARLTACSTGWPLLILLVSESATVTSWYRNDGSSVGVVMYPVLVKIFHGPGPRKRSRGVAANASERRPLGTPACAVIRLAKNALCASRRSMLLSFLADLPATCVASPYFLPARFCAITN